MVLSIPVCSCSVNGMPVGQAYNMHRRYFFDMTVCVCVCVCVWGVEVGGGGTFGERVNRHPPWLVKVTDLGQILLWFRWVLADYPEDVGFPKNVT